MEHAFVAKVLSTEDLPEGLIKLYETYLSEFGIDQAKEKILAFLSSLCKCEWIEIFVVLEAETVVAFAIVGNTYSSVDCEHSYEIKDLYVSPSYRGRGVGRMLLANVKKWCVGKKISSIFVYTDDLAKSFYLESGWAELGNLLLKISLKNQLMRDVETASP